jgi:RNA polymerase sigma-70 factor (ECF subfamily)
MADAKMNWNRRKEDEFKALLNRFAVLIKVQINKFNLQKFGLDPEDVSQEIKIKIWKILHNEKEIKNYPSYIRKIINSSVIDLLRKWKREEAIFIYEKQKRVSEIKKDYLADIFSEDNFRETIGQAVNSLIESRRKVVKLFLLSMTIEEISAYFSWSKDKTRNLLYRGLADLREILKKKDIDYEDK